MAVAETYIEQLRNFVDHGPNPQEYEEKDLLDFSFIFDSDLPPGPRILYTYIVSKVDPEISDDGGVTIAMETLGRRLNISYATTWKYCKRLENLGYLRIEQNSAGHNRYYPLHRWSHGKPGS